MGEKQNQSFQLSFNTSLKVDFQGSRVTSDGGLILIRELDERLGLEKLIEEHLSDSRQGLNKQFTLADLLLLAYNLGNLWHRLVLPKRIDAWSLTSLQQRLVKTGGRLIKHARYYWLLLAESHLTRRLFGQMLRRIWALTMPSG